MSSYLRGIANRVNGVEKQDFTKELDINSLVPSKNNFYGIREIEELAASIKENGLMHNLVVRSLNNGKYEIISGERRYTALKKLGYEKVPCQIREINDLDAELMLIHANLDQRELTPTEKMEGIKRLENIYKQKRKNGEKLEGKTRNLIGKDLGMSGVQVGRYKKVDKDLIPELKEKLNKEDITLTQAHTLSSLTKEEQKIIHYEIKNLNPNESKEEINILIEGTKQPLASKEDKELLDEMYNSKDIIENLKIILEKDSNPRLILNSCIKAVLYTKMIKIIDNKLNITLTGDKPANVFQIDFNMFEKVDRIPVDKAYIEPKCGYKINKFSYLWFKNWKVN